MKEGWIGCAFGEEEDLITEEYIRSPTYTSEEVNIRLCLYAVWDRLFFSYRPYTDEEKRTQSMS